MTIAILLCAITLIVCLAQTISFRRLYRYVDYELLKPATGYAPKISVILPCKGLDPDFDENISKLLLQDYRDFEVVFTVASQTDPAYQHLSEICAKRSCPAPATKIVISGVNSTRAQKINNQLHALEQISPQSQVIVFVDSDVIARPDFLRCLVDPLSDAKVGVTTGYRFYISTIYNWPSMLRSLWNRVSAWEMASPKYAFAWGGAMAIRREVFDKAQVKERWDKAADDDLSLTTAVKALGLKVHFVPQCLVASDGDASIGEIFEWTNRQLILTKVYYRELWVRAITRAVIMAVWLIAMIIAVLGFLFMKDPYCLQAIICGLTIVPVEIFFLIVARGLWQRVLADRSDYLRESFWSSCAAIPLAHLVLPWLTLFSVLTNRIQWRGVKYELRSTTETLVIS
jgi:ceramide glucosyltransferase